MQDAVVLTGSIMTQIVLHTWRRGGREREELGEREREEVGVGVVTGHQEMRVVL